MKALKIARMADLAAAARRWTWPLRYHVGSLGMVGIVLLCAAATIALWQLTDRDRVESRIRDLHQQARELADQAAALPPARASDATRELETVPNLRDHGSDLQALFEAAKANDVTIERSDYQTATGTDGPLTVVVATLPVRGSYAQLKRFANDALVRLPHLALQDLRMERPDIGTTELRARVRVALYYRRSAR